MGPLAKDVRAHQLQLYLSCLWTALDNQYLKISTSARRFHNYCKTTFFCGSLFFAVGRLIRFRGVQCSRLARFFFYNHTIGNFSRVWFSRISKKSRNPRKIDPREKSGFTVLVLGHRTPNMTSASNLYQGFYTSYSYIFACWRYRWESDDKNVILWRIVSPRRRFIQSTGTFWKLNSSRRLL